MAEITDEDVIRELVGGAVIRASGGRGYDGYEYRLEHPSRQIDSLQVNRLIDAGWLYSSNTAYFLTDEGKKAYLRSTDELGNGKLELGEEAKKQEEVK